MTLSAGHGRGRRRSLVHGVIILALGVAGCLTASRPSSGASTVRPSPHGHASNVCTPTTVLNRWPLQRLANETIVFPVEETDLLGATAAVEAGYGGLILFGTAAPPDLGAQLAALRAEVPDHLGLLVMTDEEGGGVQRMANLVGSMPWAAQMGATMSPAEIETLAGSVGARMLANGVSMDLAPVVDVDGRAVEPSPQNPDGFRSFSGSTSVVSTDGVAFARGMQAAGVVPVVKHFPGLGGASQNTDNGPASTLPWPILEQEALPPFEAAIAAGLPAIMVSNATVPGFTAGPAGLSAKLVTGELRRALGFKGLILTDSLSAGAIAGPPLSLPVPQAAVAALQAGDDMVLFDPTFTTGRDVALAVATSNAIVAAVNSGVLPKAQLVAAAAQVLAAQKVHLCQGYWMVTSKGRVLNFGDAGFLGSLRGRVLPARLVGMASTRDGAGYWLVTAKGNVYNFGAARFLGSLRGRVLPARLVGMASTRDGAGYWLVTAKGNVYNFGAARFLGSLRGRVLPARVVGMASTPDGAGYWLVTAKGNVYNFGAARFLGSLRGRVLPARVVGMASTPDGAGYWLVTAKGNVYNFGDAGFYGSKATTVVPAPVVGMAATTDGLGYWLVTARGNLFNFGDARFYGSEANGVVPVQVVGFAQDRP